MTKNHAVKSSLLYFSFFFSDNEGKNLKHLSATEGMTYMNIGNAITEIRKTQGLTQEEFGAPVCQAHDKKISIFFQI